MKKSHCFRSDLVPALASMALVLSACGGGGSDGGSGDSADVPLSSAPPLVQQYAGMLNEARGQARSCGGTAAPAVAPLTTWNPKLQQAAQKHSDDMSSRGFRDHTGSDGSTPNSRAAAAGYNAYSGEILASGFSSANAVMSAWLASPSHCLALMAAEHKTVAVAQTGKYVTVDFGL